jgi:hypothetical protein
MRNIIFICLSLLFVGCAAKIPFSKQLMDDFNLTEKELRKVQFYTSHTIILERQTSKSNNARAVDRGELVVSSSSLSERIVIPANRRCILEGIDEETGDVKVRFEMGAGRYLTFTTVPNRNNQRMYLKAVWRDGRGELDYGGGVYFAVGTSSAAYLQVKLKQLQRNRRSDRVVKGMRV